MSEINTNNTYQVFLYVFRRMNTYKTLFGAATNNKWFLMGGYSGE
jgi:hypothetical protein